MTPGCSRSASATDAVLDRSQPFEPALLGGGGALTLEPYGYRLAEIRSRVSRVTPEPDELALRFDDPAPHSNA